MKENDCKRGRNWLEVAVKVKKKRLYGTKDKNVFVYLTANPNQLILLQN